VSLACLSQKLSSICLGSNSQIRNPYFFCNLLSLMDLRRLSIPSAKLEELEHKYQLHETDIQVIFEAIKKLLEPPPEPPRPRFDMN